MKTDKSKEHEVALQEFISRTALDISDVTTKDGNVLIPLEKLGLALEKMSEFRQLMTYYKCAIMEIETKFNVMNEEYNLQHDRNPISNIKSRLKSPQSIFEKLKRKKLEVTLENVEKELHDIAGIRIICNFKDDVYMVAQSLLMQDDITLIEKKDYISLPKKSGYRSLHLIVSVPIFLAFGKKDMEVEIQIRTLSMDSFASMEHQLRYKKDFKITDDVIKDLLYCAKLEIEIDEKMEELKKRIFDDENK